MSDTAVDLDSLCLAQIERFSESSGRGLSTIEHLKTQRLTRDEARSVFEAKWAYLEANPEARALFDLVENIVSDLARGWRCPVCFGVDDPDCIEGC